MVSNLPRPVSTKLGIPPGSSLYCFKTPNGTFRQKSASIPCEVKHSATQGGAPDGATAAPRRFTFGLATAYLYLLQFYCETVIPVSAENTWQKFSNLWKQNLYRSLEEWLIAGFFDIFWFGGR